MQAEISPLRHAPAPPRASSNGHSGPRLAPVEKPTGLLLRFIYWAGKKRFGIVPNGMKVVIPRVPRLMRVSAAAHRLHKHLHIHDETIHLVTLQVASINGCGFCVDLGRMMAFTKDLDMKKSDRLTEYETDPIFPERQRAAIAYADEVTRTRNVSDATFARLKKHFDDRQIAELTVMIAFENMANLINVPLGIGSDGLCAIAQARKR